MRLAMMGNFPRDPEHIGGGVEAVILYLLKGLQQFEDMDLHVVTLRSDINQQVTVTHNGITAHYLPANYRLNAIVFDAYHRRLLRRELSAIQPDVVHAHINGTYAMSAFGSGFPTVLTIHGVRRSEMAVQRDWRDQLYRRWLVTYQEWVSVRTAKHVIAISPPYIRQEFSQVINGTIYDIENPIPDKFFDLERHEEPNRILFAGHIRIRKGVLELLKAVDLVRRQIPDLQLRIAGRTNVEPDYFEKVQAYISDRGLEDCVYLLGSLDEASLLDEYARCALLVLPSRQETAPMVIEQAMAARVPVVATRVGGVDYLVNHGHTGYVVDFGDIEDLADKMLCLLADADLRTKMGQAARIEADQRFRADIVARKTRNVYNQVLGRP